MRLKAHCTIKRKPLIRKEPEENYIHKPFLHNVKTSFVKNDSCSYVNFDWREAHLVCLPLIKTQCWTVVSTRACNSRASPGKMAACHGNQFQCFAEAFNVFPWQHHPAENIWGISSIHTPWCILISGTLILCCTAQWLLVNQHFIHTHYDNKKPFTEVNVGVWFSSHSIESCRHFPSQPRSK